MDSEISNLVRRIVNDLSDGKYDAVIQRTVKSRLTASDLRNVIDDYGRTPVRPPDSAYGLVDVIRVRSEAPCWSVRVPLWTREEGRSDLTLDLTLVAIDGNLQVELDDLHVL